MNLAAIDLNLLVALDALLLERNVTRAGRRIGLSQSAMSHALKRLRELLDDPLLVRSGQGLRLTTRAEELAPKVSRLVREISHTLLDGVAFDPAQDARTFTIATNDYCGLVVLPRLVAQLRKSAPRVDLNVRALGRELPFAAMDDGEIDVAIGTFLESSRHLLTKKLFAEHFVCAVSRETTPPNLEEFTGVDHILISSPGEGPGIVDYALARLGMSRHVALRVPYFSVAPAIIEGTDLLLTVPSRIAQMFEPLARILIFDPPLDLPGFDVAMWWHSGTERDPARLWLRDQISRAVRG